MRPGFQFLVSPSGRLTGSHRVREKILWTSPAFHALLHGVPIMKMKSLLLSCAAAGLAEGVFGMDAEDYQEKCRMLIRAFYCSAPVMSTMKIVQTSRANGPS